MTLFNKTVAALTVTGLLLTIPRTSRADDPLDMDDPGSSSSPDRSPGISPENSRGFRSPPPMPPGTSTWGTSESATDAYGNGNAGSTLPSSPALPSTGSLPPTSTTTTTFGEYTTEYAPPADKVRTSYSPHKGLLISGASILGSTYATSAIVGATSSNDSDRKLYIPVVGPWLDMADRSCRFGDCGAKEDMNNALLLASGVSQAAGLGLLIAGLIVQDPGRSGAQAKAPPKPEIHVLPTSVGAGPGVGAVGTF